jgi:hypothetical protein
MENGKKNREIKNFVTLTVKCRPRCSVRIFSPSHAARFGAPYDFEGICLYYKFKTPVVLGSIWNLNPRVIYGLRRSVQSKKEGLI